MRANLCGELGRGRQLGWRLGRPRIVVAEGIPRSKSARAPRTQSQFTGSDGSRVSCHQEGWLAQSASVLTDDFATETRRHGDRSSRVSLRCALLRVSVPPWQIIRSRSLSLLFSCGQIYAARLVGAFNLGGGSAALGFPWALPYAWIRLRLETLRHLFLNSGMLATTRRARCALTVNCSPDLFMPAPNAFHHPKTLSSPTRQEGCGPS